MLETEVVESRRCRATQFPYTSSSTLFSSPGSLGGIADAMTSKFMTCTRPRLKCKRIKPDNYEFSRTSEITSKKYKKST